MTSCLPLPRPLQGLAFSYLFPFLEEDVKTYVALLELLGYKCPIMTRLAELKAKYRKFPVYGEDVLGGSCLLDALSSGCIMSFARGTCARFEPETEDDIKFLLRAAPESTICARGFLIDRARVSPLGMACVNPKVPTHIVELLLQNGADPDCTHYMIRGRIRIIDDMRHHMSAQRYAELLEVFLKYKGST